MHMTTREAAQLNCSGPPTPEYGSKAFTGPDALFTSLAVARDVIKTVQANWIGFNAIIGAAKKVCRVVS